MSAFMPTRATSFVGGLVAVLTLASLGAGQAPPADTPGSTTKSDAPRKPATSQEVADLEKQIRELTTRLEALKKQQAEAPIDTARRRRELLDHWVKSLRWRQIGPANMGGRIVALSVVENDPSTYYVATASGGLLKTTNNGITFEHQFDRERSVAIGDVCVAPSNRDIVWVGTGENNPRNSVSYGDGVYKSTDGGKTWTNMGLKASYQIGRIVVHPRDPDIVYVGALGRLFGPNDERGLFKTTDGGKTWTKIHYVDDKTGVIDVRMHPNDPDTLIIATYERRRGIYDEGDPIVKWGEGAGLFKTTDGGKSWKKLTAGLPTVKLGRIGLDWYRKNANVVFAIIETEKIGFGPPRPEGAGNGVMGIQGGDRDGKAALTVVTEGGPAEKAGLRPGDFILSIAGRNTRTYEDLVDVLQDHKAGDVLKVKAERDGKPLEVELTLALREARPEGGGGAQAGGPDRRYGANLGGQRENVQDRQGPEGFQYGGVYKSTDGGESWSRINSLNPRPFYFSQVRVDPSDDQFLYVLGIALYRSSDGGKTFRADGGRGVHADQHALWVDPRDGRHMLVGCDGGLYATYDRMNNWDHHNHMALGQFYDVAVDATRDYRVYGGLQDNGTWGGPSRSKSGGGPINEDWLNISGGDGFQCQVDPDDPNLIYATSQYGRMRRRNLETGESASIQPAPEKGQRFRFNWNTPFILSPHNGRIFTFAGNYVWRSLDRGADPRRISPEITLTKQGSATALSESPRDPNLLYVGTDDGAVWVTRDGGKDWTELTKKFGLPRPLTVASIEASRFSDGRVYVAFNGRRMDDDHPYLFVSDDYGQTWKRLGTDLPIGTSYCLREDIGNADLLYAGTEFALWASLDRGLTWHGLNTNLPTVAVHDIALHPSAGELVAATHGRSLWVLDVSALRQITADVLAAPATLFQPIPAIRWLSEPSRGRTNRRYTGENPANGSAIAYALTKPAETLSLKVVDFDGKTVREFRAGREPGLHTVTWDMTRAPVRRPNGRGGPGGPGGGPRTGGRVVPAGQYHVVLTVDGKEHARTFRVQPDPTAAPAVIIAEFQRDEDAPEPDDALLDEDDEVRRID